MKNKTIIIVLVVLALLCLTIGGIALSETETNFSADGVENTSVKKIVEINEEEFARNVAILEHALANSEVDIIEQLINRIVYYEKLLLTVETREEAEKIQDMINITEELLWYFQDEQPRGGPSILNPLKWQPVFLTAMGSILAYFEACGYNLASELLSQAWCNEVKDSVYVPVNESRVLSSAVVTNVIANGENTFGGASFANSGTYQEKDLYFALHDFDYSKTYYSSGYVKIWIQDRYDFDFTLAYSDPVAVAAANVMATAESLGFLTPYRVSITQIVAGTMPANAWSQPTFSSSSNSHGTVTASGPILSGEDGWRAFDGIIANHSGSTYYQWTANAKQGYIELQLNYYIKVYQIDFYQRVSSTSNYTKTARFWSGDPNAAGVRPLGAQFDGKKQSLGKSVIPVNNVVTNVIRLDVESSFGSYIGANEIIIHATQSSIDEYVHQAEPVATVSGDFDGDGVVDIAQFHGHGSTTFIAVWSSTGSGLTYRGIWWYSTQFDVNKIKGRVAAGNFQGNANGRDTIIAFYDNGYSWTDAFFFTYDWGGSFNNGADIVLVWRSYIFYAIDITDRVVSGDFDGDGQDEIIAFHNDGGYNTSVYMFQFDDITNLLNGGSLYWPPVWSSTTFCANDITGRVIAGNFDSTRQGDEIIVFHDDGGNNMSAYMFRYSNGVLNDGSSYWPPIWSSTTFNANDITGRVVAGNFQGNANGREDVVVFHNDGGNNASAYLFSYYAFTGLLNDGSSYWPPVWSSTTYNSDAITERLVSGNFTNNGKDEIIAFYIYPANNQSDTHMFSYNDPNLSYVLW